MKKRILSLVLCAAMLLSMCLFLGAGVMDDTTADGSAETTETVDGVNIVSFTNAGPLVKPEQTVGPARVRAFAANDTGSGVKLDKMVTGPDDDGNYTVRLEAYATGEQTTTVSTKPCDIVLVLDVSGSMDWCIVCGGNGTSYHYKYAETNAVSNSGEYYIKTDSGYTRVYYCDGEHSFGPYTWECDGGAGWYTSTVSSNHTSKNKLSPKTANNPTGEQFFERTGTEACTSRMSALKSAVNTFIEEVAKKETATVKHNISIVKFAGKSNDTVGDKTYTEDGYKYNYSQIVMNLMDASDKQKDLMDAVNNLKAGGATRADYGMQHAQSILSNRSADRKDATKVVVMFTDGEPTNGREFQSSVANDAISAAKELKASGATVYTVGCMNGADARRVDNISALSDTNVNKYMHLVSSNYKNATSMSDPGDATYPTDTSKSYYLSANNSTELNNVFESISQQIGGSKTDLTSTAVLKDAVTPYFEIPGGAGAQVTLKTANCTGADDNGKLTFDAETDTDVPPDVEATVNGNTVSVTGFDYKAHWCGNHSGIYDGQKLIVEFKIRPTNDFLGGNGVQTNVGTDDGIYESSEAGKEPVERFAPQNVNVAVKQVTVNDNKTEIYRGNSTNLEDLVKISDKLNSTNNAYVTTTYTIKDGDTTIATYTVKPGEAIGEWNTSTEVSPDSTHEYTVTCEVKNADSSDVQTAYAKLTVVVNTCSLKITKTVKGEGANPNQNQTFVFNVMKDGKAVTTVVLKGNTSTTITGLAVGDYTVVEDTNWSWSYTPDNGRKAVTLSSTNPNDEAKIINTAKENHWLTSIVDVINKWTAKNDIDNTRQVPGPGTN